MANLDSCESVTGLGMWEATENVTPSLTRRKAGYPRHCLEPNVMRHSVDGGHGTSRLAKQSPRWSRERLRLCPSSGEEAAAARVGQEKQVKLPLLTSNNSTHGAG